MARKPAKMYRRVKGPSFTRRKYTGGVPNNRILQFHVGNRRAAETGQFEMELELCVDEPCQIRHTALEAACCIQLDNSNCSWSSRIRPARIHTYPHQILRENKQATGAGADRVSQGMRCAFGKNVGTAARVKRGQRFISIKCHPKDYLAAKDALRKAGMKVPSSCTTRLVRGAEHVKGLV